MIILDESTRRYLFVFLSFLLFCDSFLFFTFSSFFFNFELFVTLIFVSTLFITNAIFQRALVFPSFLVASFWLYCWLHIHSLGAKPALVSGNISTIRDRKERNYLHWEKVSRRKEWNGSETFFSNSFVLTLWAISKVLLDRELQIESSTMPPSTNRQAFNLFFFSVMSCENKRERHKTLLPKKCRGNLFKNNGLSYFTRKLKSHIIFTFLI